MLRHTAPSPTGEGVTCTNLFRVSQETDTPKVRQHKPFNMNAIFIPDRSVPAQERRVSFLQKLRPLCVYAVCRVLITVNRLPHRILHRLHQIFMLFGGHAVGLCLFGYGQCYGGGAGTQVVDRRQQRRTK